MKDRDPKYLEALESSLEHWNDETDTPQSATNLFIAAIKDVSFIPLILSHGLTTSEGRTK